MTNQDFDDILITLKTSKWNLFHFLIIGILIFTIPSVILSGIFLTPKIGHVCKPNVTEEFTILSNCTYSVLGANATKNYTKQCTRWKYESEYFNSSLTQELDLVCERSNFRPTFHTMFMMGNFFGYTIYGFLTDRFGRKRCLTIGWIAFLIMHLGTIIISDIYTILVFRFLSGVCQTTLNAGYILCLEICEPKHRSKVGILLSLPWAFGTIFYGALGYLIKDWRWLQAISIIPALIATIFFIYFSESPRWLIVNGDFEKAMTTLQRAAKWNGSKLPPEHEIYRSMNRIQTSLKPAKEIHVSTNQNNNCFNVIIKQAFLLFMSRKLRKITFFMCVLFFTASMVYYGMSINADNYNLDPFMYMIIGGVVEIPAYSITVPIIGKFGRIMPAAISYLTSGIVIMALAFISKDSTAIIITLAMIGKFCIASAYQFIYLMATEIFPTECRTQGLATLQLISRIGSISSPYITDSVVSSHPWVPSVIFGSASIFAGICAFFLPETLNAHLPETIAMLEDNSHNEHKECIKEELECLKR